MCTVQNKQHLIDEPHRSHFKTLSDKLSMVPKISANYTRFHLIRSMAVKKMKWILCQPQDDYNGIDVFWHDNYVSQHMISILKSYQKINHFPLSKQLGNKDLLIKNLKILSKSYPLQYNFYPRSWSLRAYSTYQSIKKSQKQQRCKIQHKNNQNDKNSQQPVYIVKPASSSQGNGIYLTYNVKVSHTCDHIIQEYLKNPLLIDGLKFDLRLYVLLVSLFPLKIMLFTEGLGRLATIPYEEPTHHNMHNKNMHLTNYAINKNNPDFIPNLDSDIDNRGHKRSYTAIIKIIEENGVNIELLQHKIDAIIIKTILSAYEKMGKAYLNVRNLVQSTCEEDSVCFELFGFDIMILDNYQPILIEVNHMPSLSITSPLDYTIKHSLILQIYKILHFSLKKEQFNDISCNKAQVDKKNTNHLHFRQIFPNIELNSSANYCYIADIHAIYSDIKSKLLPSQTNKTSLLAKASLKFEKNCPMKLNNSKNKTFTRDVFKTVNSPAKQLTVNSEKQFYGQNLIKRHVQLHLTHKDRYQEQKNNSREGQNFKGMKNQNKSPIHQIEPKTFPQKSIKKIIVQRGNSQKNNLTKQLFIKKRTTFLERVYNMDSRRKANEYKQAAYSFLKMTKKDFRDKNTLRKQPSQILLGQ